MLDPRWQSEHIQDFLGQMSYLEAGDVPPGGATLVRNAEFVDGLVRTRRGFTYRGVSAPYVANSITNWLSPNANWIIWFQPRAGVKYENIGATSSGTLAFRGEWRRDDSSLTSIVVLTNVATATTNASHALAVGDQVVISGATVDADLNGTYQVATVPSLTTFTFTTASVADATYNESTLVIETRVGMTFAPWEARLYTGSYSRYGAGCTTPSLLMESGGVLVQYSLFPPPMTYVPSAPTEPSAGSITTGSHRLGYIVEYKHHPPIRPSPDSGAGTPGTTTFVPLSFTATGSKNLSWTLNPTTWPYGAAKVWIVMSPVSNPSRYFIVPGTGTAVPDNAAGSRTIVWSISDDDLVATGLEITDYLSHVTRTTSELLPFSASVVLGYGDRMVYLARLADESGAYRTMLLASDRQSPQHIAYDRSTVRLPGGREPVAACVFRDRLYIFARGGGTFMTQDNGLDPVEWPVPQLVDPVRGTLSPTGVDVAASGDVLWVADPSGLFAFDGAYSPRPISYTQTDWWQKIDWSYSWQVQVRDLPTKRKVYVLFPASQAANAGWMMTWDYSRGLRDVRCSVDDISGYTPRSMCVLNSYVLNTSSYPKDITLLIGPAQGSAATNLLVGIPPTGWATTYLDTLGAANTQSVAFSYKTGGFPSRRPFGQLLRHQAMRLRALGVGTLTVQVNNADGTLSATLSNVTLAAAPGKEYFRQFHHISEGAYYQIATTGTAGTEYWVALSALTHYWCPFPALHR